MIFFQEKTDKSVEKETASIEKQDEATTLSSENLDEASTPSNEEVEEATTSSYVPTTCHTLGTLFFFFYKYYLFSPIQVSIRITNPKETGARLEFLERCLI